MPASLRSIPGADDFRTDVVPVSDYSTQPIPRVAGVPVLPVLPVLPEVPRSHPLGLTRRGEFVACTALLLFVAFAGPISRGIFTVFAFLGGGL